MANKNKFKPFLGSWTTIPENMEDLGAFFNKHFSGMADNINNKEIGTYYPFEAFNGQLWFRESSTKSTRNGFRKVINMGTLPNAAGPLTKPHGLEPDSNFRLTNLWAAATDPTGLNYIIIPYLDIVGGNHIGIDMTATDVIIRVTSNRAAFTSCYAVIEYCRSV